MRPLFLLYSLLFCAAPLFAADPQEEEIDHLIAFVRDASVRFIRNGKEHSGVEAAEHMQKKREHFAKKIDSAERFIELAASRSLVSKKPYQVQLADGRTLTSSEWLLAELARYRSEGTDPAP